MDKLNVHDPEMANLSLEQRKLVIAALRLDKPEPLPSCSFELNAELDHVASRVERYDPNIEADSPWTLMSIKGRDPSKRERNQKLRYTRISPGDAWGELRENVDWDSLEVDEESEAQLGLVGLVSFQVREDERVDADISIWIDTDTRSVSRVATSLKKPHKINFAATVTSMTRTQIYRYEAELARPILQELIVDWNFRFVAFPATSKEYISYQNYSCPKSLQKRLCE